MWEPSTGKYGYEESLTIVFICIVLQTLFESLKRWVRE